MMRTRPSQDSARGDLLVPTHSDRKSILPQQRFSLNMQQTPLLLPITTGEQDFTGLSPKRKASSSNAPIITHFSVTPTTQMVISDAKTLIIDSSGNNMVTTKLSRAQQLLSTGESRASQSGKVKVSITHQPSSSLHERKKSVGRPGKISPLKE